MLSSAAKNSSLPIGMAMALESMQGDGIGEE